MKKVKLEWYVPDEVEVVVSEEPLGPDDPPAPNPDDKYQLQEVPKNLRAVWLQGLGTDTPEERTRVMDALARAEANLIIWSSSLYERTFYPSDLLTPRSDDALSPLLELAKARGIDVAAAIHPGLLYRVSSDWNVANNGVGLTEPWFDFRYDNAVSFVADVAEELVTRWPGLAGIALDHMRWRNLNAVRAGLHDWYITDAACEIGERVHAHGKALIGVPDGGRFWPTLYLGQNWEAWLKCGYVDYVIGMCYHTDDWILARMDEWRDAGLFPERIAPLLSLAWFPWNEGHDTEEPKTVDEVLHQCNLVRSGGVRGIGLFDNRFLTRNTALINALGSGGW